MSVSNRRADAEPTPLGPGMLLGAGLGGLFDGIVLHQILQWHQMLSTRLPPTHEPAMRLNMAADGLFHAVMWLLVLAGLVALVRRLRRSAGRCSGTGLAGALLLGWGGFNVVEGVVDHHLLQLHHVVEALADPWPADAAFLGVSVLIVALGALLVALARR